MTLISPNTVKAAPIQLLFPQGPDGSSSSSALKMAKRHLCWLCNLFHSLQKAENTQNRPKFREECFPVAKVIPTTNSLLFSPKNSTKIGVAGVSLAKISKNAKRGGLRPKTRQPLAFNLNVNSWSHGLRLTRRFQWFGNHVGNPWHITVITNAM